MFIGTVYWLLYSVGMSMIIRKNFHPLPLESSYVYYGCLFFLIIMCFELFHNFLIIFGDNFAPKPNFFSSMRHSPYCRFVFFESFRSVRWPVFSQLIKKDRVREAVVLAKENERGDKYLCAYFVSDKRIPVSDFKNSSDSGFLNFLFRVHP